MADNMDRSVLDQTTRLVSESLARAVNRRTFLKRPSQSVFAGLMALAVGQALPGRAAAQRSGPNPPQPPNITCSPPGPYCNTGGGNLSGCHGAHCFQHLYNGTIQQCVVYYQYYQAGCWTSGDGWTCCDCACGSPVVAHCGCAQYHGSPLPLPDGPGAKNN